MTPTSAERTRPRLARTRGSIRRQLERIELEWSQTPGKLRLARALLVFVCLLTGLVAATSVRVRADAQREIDRRTGPLSSNAIETYRSLADADATVATEFLLGRNELSDLRARYDADIGRAASSLARAGTQAGEQGLTAARIADISALLPIYTGLVEQARANHSRGSSEGVPSLRQASDLMQSTILRRAEALMRNETKRLDSQYERAGSVPVSALVLGAVNLAVLLSVQVLLFFKTRRVFNAGLLASTAAVLGVLLWGMMVFSMSHQDLERSHQHSQSVTDGLGQAQIASLQARGSEVLSLLAVDSGSYEQGFSARMARLSRNDGAGGALGVARSFAKDGERRASVEAAVVEARAWLTAHGRVSLLRDAKRYEEAVALAVGNDRAGSATAFNQLDTTLATAVALERTAFDRDIGQSQGALAGLPAGTVLLACVSAAGAARGIGQRLEEYR